MIYIHREGFLYERYRVEQKTPGIGITVYTPDEVQKIFKLGRTQTYNLMNSEGFPTLRVNRKMYVEDEALRVWMKNYTGKTFSV